MSALSRIVDELRKGVPMSGPELAARTCMHHDTILKSIKKCRSSQGEVQIRIADWREVGISLHVTAFYGIGTGDAPMPRTKCSIKQSAKRKAAKACRKTLDLAGGDMDSDSARGSHIARLAAEADAAIAKYRPNLAALKGNMFATCIAQVCRP